MNFILNVWRRIWRRPMSIIKALVPLSLVSVVLGLFLFNLFSDGVFVDDVELQGGAKDVGLRGDKLTEQALEMIPQVIEKRLQEARITRDFGEIVEYRPRGFETDRVCVRNIQLEPPNTDIYRTAISRAQASSKTPDRALAAETFSIKKLAYWVREQFGYRPRLLTPTITLENGKFILRVQEYPYSRLTREELFTDRNHAADKLSSIIVDFIAPEVRAAELVSTRQGEADQFQATLNTAKLFLQDNQKEMLINLLISELIFERTRQASEIPNASVNLHYFNMHLMKNMDFDRYGKAGVLLKAQIAARLVRSETILAGQAGASKRDLVGILDRYVNPLRADLMRSAEGRWLWYQKEFAAGRLDIAHRGVMATVASDNEPSWLRQRIMVLLMFYYLQNGDGARLRDLVDSFNDYFSVSERDFVIYPAVLLMPAAIALIEKDVDQFRRELISIREIPNCAKNLLVDVIHGVNEDDQSRHSEIYAEVVDFLIGGDVDSLRSFHHFNNLGIWLGRASRFNDAFLYFDKALKHEGDHAWAYLNWAHVAEKSGNYQLAEDRSIQSLKIGVTPAGAFNLVTALFRLNKWDQLQLNLENYYSSLSEMNYARRVLIEGYRIISSCRGYSKAKRSFLLPGELVRIDGRTLTSSEYQRLPCAEIIAAQELIPVR